MTYIFNFIIGIKAKYISKKVDVQILNSKQLSFY